MEVGAVLGGPPGAEEDADDIADDNYGNKKHNSLHSMMLPGRGSGSHRGIPLNILRNLFT